LGPKAGVNVWKEKNLLIMPGSETWVLQSVAYATLTMLCGL